jgi:hypothetical protein
VAGTGDAGTTGDASQPVSDAATTSDAGADASTPGADAASPGADASTIWPDAGTPSTDAGSSADGGSTVIANDSCLAPEALVFSNGVATATGDTTSAKGDYSSSGGCGGYGNDVVYSFTTTVDQAVEVTLTPKSTATKWTAVLYVRKGTCASGTVEVVCKESTAAGKPVALSHQRVPAGTYFLFVDGYSGSVGAFDLTVKLSTPPPAPANDTCAAPAPLTFTNNVATVQGDTSTATDDQTGTCGASKGPDMVYSFTLQTAQSVVATVIGDISSPNFVAAIYIRSKCDSGLAADEKACYASYYSSSATAKVQSLPAGTYFIWVDGSSASSRGKFKLEVNLAAPIVAPLNDTCSSPETLTFTNDVATASSDTTGAKADTSGTCAGGGKDLVYTFSTVGKGVKNIDITLAPKSPTSTFQPVVYVRKTCASSASAESMGCRDAVSPGGTASLALPRVPEGTYFLFADGFTGSEGAFDLKVTLSEPPPAPGNDNCAGATALTFTNNVATVSGDTRSATDDGGASCSSATGPDVVYSFTLQAAQAVTAKLTRDSSTSSYSPVVYLRSACASAASADEKGCGTGSSSTPATASATSLAAGTYFVWVDGSSKTSGKYTLEVTLAAPIVGPKNDNCTTAESLSFTNDVASATGDTTLAKDDTNGTCSGYTKDVVYSFSTVGQGVKNVDILVTPKSGSSSYRPVAFVRKTCASAASADELGCGSASATGKELSLSLEVVPEGTYFVFVDGYSGSAGAFDLKVTLSKPPPPPANDTCSSPTPLTFTSNVATASGTTIAGANDVAPSCGYGNTADVVYEMTLAANQKVTATVTRDSASTSFSPFLSIRSVCSQAGSELGCKSSSLGTATLTLDYLKAGKYFVWVDSSGVRGKFDLKVTLDPPVVPTQGENCFATKPLVFTNNAASDSSSTNTAKNDTSGVCGGSGPDVVYEFTTTAAHKISATVTPASGSATFDPTVYLRGVCGSSSSKDEHFCDGGKGAGKVLTAETPNAPAGKYFLFVDGFAGSKGDFTLAVNLSAPVPPPANDTCAGAAELKLGASVSGTTLVAKDDFGTGSTAPASCGDLFPPVNGADVVYSYKPTATGTATVTVTPSGTVFDPAVWVTSVTCSADISACVKASDTGLDGDPETLSFSVTAGTVYYIYVDTQSFSRTPGDFTIVVK